MFESIGIEKFSPKTQKLVSATLSANVTTNKTRYEMWGAEVTSFYPK